MMELQRGICILCKENNKVVNPSDAEEFIDLIPQVINKKFLVDAEFQKLKCGIKLCLVCCHKLKIANEIRRAIKSVKLVDNANDQQQNCRFCKCDENLVQLKNDWKYFNERAEGYLEQSEFPVRVCPRCFYYFDTVYNFKSNLLYKYPQLNMISKPSPKSVLRNSLGTPISNSKVTPRKRALEPSSTDSDTPKRNSQSKSPPSVKKRKMFDNCFNYLQPLSQSTYQVGSKLKTDERIYSKIPYVDLSVFLDKKLTKRPSIKIKLKPKHKKSFEIIHSKHEQSGIDETKTKRKSKKNNHKPKSDEGPSKKHEKLKARRPLRRYSCSVNIEHNQAKTEEATQNLEETPKAPTNANLVPKRRVSLFIDTIQEGEQEVNDEVKETHKEDTDKIMEKQPEEFEVEKDKESEPQTTETESQTKEVSELVEKFIENISEEEKLDLFEEIEKNVEESEKSSDVVNNSIRKSDEATDVYNNINGQENGESDSPQVMQKNGDKLENDPCLSGSNRDILSENESPDVVPDALVLSKSSDDNKAYEESINLEESERFDDSLNSSERKKKRVTFSDEVN